MTNKSKIVLGLLGAAAAGVVVGLILAPEKGTDLRAKISQKAGGWADHLTDLFANAKGEIENLTDKGTKAASKVAGDVVNKFNSTKESYS
jgi:gas vesicle protein